MAVSEQPMKPPSSDETAVECRGTRILSLALAGKCSLELDQPATITLSSGLCRIGCSRQ
jgi:hypothetical protein